MFVLRVGDGADVIADWEDGVDRMDLTDFGLSFAEIEALAVDLPIGAVRITLGGGDQFQINGFSTADLDVSDFV